MQRSSPSPGPSFCHHGFRPRLFEGASYGHGAGLKIASRL